MLKAAVKKYDYVA